MSTLASVIREEIKRARLANKLTQQQLADACDNISKSDISAYENGKRNPALNKLELIAKALGKEWKLK